MYLMLTENGLFCLKASEVAHDQLSNKEGIMIGSHRSECYYRDASEWLRQFSTIIIWCERCIKKCSNCLGLKVAAGKN